MAHFFKKKQCNHIRRTVSEGLGDKLSGIFLIIFVFKTSFYLFFRLFSVFTNNTILQQNTVKNVHQVSVAGIRTHDLLNMSRFP